MYYNYLDLAERLNATLPNEDKHSAKIYVWTHIYDNKKHGVEVCIDGQKEDVAVNCKRSAMIPNVIKAYGIITKKLGLANIPDSIRLRSGKLISINN